MIVWKSAAHWRKAACSVVIAFASQGNYCRTNVRASRLSRQPWTHSLRHRWRWVGKRCPSLPLRMGAWCAQAVHGCRCTFSFYADWRMLHQGRQDLPFDSRLTDTTSTKGRYRLLKWNWLWCVRLTIVLRLRDVLFTSETVLNSSSTTIILYQIIVLVDIKLYLWGWYE